MNATKITTTKLDLFNGVNLHIGGEIGRYHTIPIDYFIKLSQNLQNLIYTLAKFEIITEGAIDLNNFQIELSGFGEGGAIPQFCFTRRIQTVTGGDVLDQRELVNERLNFLMTVADSGDYASLKDTYKGPFKRNHITDDLYKFISGLGTTPVTFVSLALDDEHPKPIYKLRKFKKETRDELMTRIIDSRSLVFEEHYAYAKVKVTNRGGKIKNRIQEIFDNTEAAMSFAPTVIEYENKRYILNNPLRCLFEKTADYYIIQSEMLGIMGTGITEDEATHNFCQEFDFIYQRYNKLAFGKLSDRIKKIKILLDFLVEKVEKKGPN